MTPEEAIKTAIEYETRIRDVYREAAETATNATGKRIFEALQQDEQNHIAYLKDRLDKWQAAGQLDIEGLQSALPSKVEINQEVDKLKTEMNRDDHKLEMQMMSKALQVEIETSRFYAKMVDTLPDPSRQMFARFLEIEEGHINIVQAELDYLTKTGYWFDIKEFDME